MIAPFLRIFFCQEFKSSWPQFSLLKIHIFCKDSQLKIPPLLPLQNVQYTKRNSLQKGLPDLENIVSNKQSPQTRHFCLGKDDRRLESMAK